MLVVVTSCIAQLKFRHFQESRPLHHLQLFDDASRGPWGAFMMLLVVRMRAVVAALLAVVTIIALGIEPSAQQILEFPTRTSVLEYGTAELGIAESYQSKGLNGVRDETGQLIGSLPFQI